MLKAKINLNLKIVVQMSEWSQMTELDNLSKSETPNLPSSEKVADRRNLQNYRVLFRPNGEE